jgi:hypothetical protein
MCVAQVRDSEKFMVNARANDKFIGQSDDGEAAAALHNLIH